MRVCAEINVAALIHNLNNIRGRTPHSKVMAMIKANAYGHGLVSCAEHLDADYLGVATLDEGRILRESGMTGRIVLMAGFHQKAELDQIVALELDSVVYDEIQLDLLARYRGAYRLPVWLKVDTGMHRLGCPLSEAVSFLRRLEACPDIKIEAVTSHLACADEPHHPHTLMQLQRFSDLTATWPYQKSIMNSAGLLHYPDFHFDIVRPGLALYGVSPVQDRSATELGLEAVMTLKSTIVALREVMVGEGLGYGIEWKASRPSRIAIVSTGYGDGYPQHPKGAEARVRGQLCPVVGRVSMDFLSLDVTKLQDVAVLDEVILWGKNIEVAEVARAMEVSVYPLLTGVMARVPRCVLKV